MAWDDEYQYQPNGWTTFSDPNILARIGEKPAVNYLSPDIAYMGKPPPQYTPDQAWEKVKEYSGYTDIKEGIHQIGEGNYLGGGAQALVGASNVPVSPIKGAALAIKGAAELAPLAVAGAGIMVGRKAKGVDLQGLKEAENLALKNEIHNLTEPLDAHDLFRKQNEEIRQKTGWFPLADKRYRTELSDVGSEKLAIPNYLKVAEEYQKSGISGVYPPLNILMPHHTNLYTAYPGAADIGVRLHGPAGTGSYDPFFDRITVGHGILPPPGVPMSAKQQDDLWSSLLHEVTHAIQSREGFARGGSPREFYPKNYEGLAKDFDALEKEVANLGMKQGFPKDLINKIMRETIAGKVDPLSDYGNIPGLAGGLEKYKQQHTELQGIRDIAFQQYERLAGEAEARLVQNRRSLTETERRKFSPLKPAEQSFFGIPVAPDQQIIRPSDPFVYPLIADRDSLLGDLKRPVRTMPPPRDDFLSMR